MANKMETTILDSGFRVFIFSEGTNEPKACLNTRLGVSGLGIQSRVLYIGLETQAKALVETRFES